MSAIVHYVRSLFFKQQRDFAEFYKSSLLYLAFISIDSLSDDQKLVQPCSPVTPDQPSVTPLMLKLDQKAACCGWPSLPLTAQRTAALVIQASTSPAQSV